MKVGELISSQGFDNLKLGDDRVSVRERFGAYRTFRRTSSAPETDQFGEWGLMVTYDDDSRVAFIELAPPASPTIQGLSLIGRSLDHLTADLRAHGITLVKDTEGAYLEGLGVGLYAPSGIVEALSVGELLSSFTGPRLGHIPNGIYSSSYGDGVAVVCGQ